MESATRIASVIGICCLILGRGMLSSAQSNRHDVFSEPVQARDAIEEIAGSLGRSVVCDIDLPQATVILAPLANKPDQALTQLLRYPRYFTVDLSGVIIVAGNSAQARDNYRPERIAACRLAGQDTTKMDILFHASQVETILGQLTTALGRRAVFTPTAANGQRSFNVQLFAVTKTDAIGIICLATHYEVRSVGDELIFSEYAAGPPPVHRPTPPN